MAETSEKPNGCRIRKPVTEATVYGDIYSRWRIGHDFMRWFWRFACTPIGDALIWNRFIRINRRIGPCRFLNRSRNLLPTLNGKPSRDSGMDGYAIASFFGWGFMWGWAIINENGRVRSVVPFKRVRKFGRIAINLPQ